MVTALAFCGACLSQQDQKSPSQSSANAAQTAPELQSPAKASEGAAAFDVGKFPIGVVSDGTNIWVANGGSNTVTKLRARDGVVLGTFRVGKFPIGLAFDGTNIWVANGESNNVMKLQTTDGTVLGTFNVGTKPALMAFDRANIWVTNEHSNNVMKLRATVGVPNVRFADKD